MSASRTGKRERTRYPINNTWLTAREMETLRLIVRGHQNKQMAAAMGVSIKTVEKFRQNVNVKLRVDNPIAASRVALRAGFISLDEWMSSTEGENVKRHGFVSGLQMSESSLASPVAE